MDCKNVVAVTDSTNYSALLEEAALLVRQVFNLFIYPLIYWLIDQLSHSFFGFYLPGQFIIP